MASINSGEFFRKVIHLSSAVIPLSHKYIFKDKVDMIIILSMALIFSFFIELTKNKNLFISSIFKKYLFFMMRDSEKKGDISGATWVIVGSLFTIILVPNPFCIISLFFLAIGDSFAALVGIKYPYKKIINNKTLSGSLACFIACYIVANILNQNLNQMILFFGAFTATMIELFLVRINDNISMPILSGLAMYIISNLI